ILHSTRRIILTFYSIISAHIYLEDESLIITSHLRFEEWGDIFGNAKATKVIIDRLTHHYHIIETGNKSFRGGKDVN
ncbi:MAG: ATP-binding protein, partial [Candidatus Tisiphia sp.]